MPIYEYKCPSCGHKFEVLRKISDDPDGHCPVCKTQAKRVFHPVGVIFKGSGFYTTDYSRRDSSPKGEQGKESSSKDAKSNAAAKSNGSEATPAAKPSKTDSKTDGN